MTTDAQIVIKTQAIRFRVNKSKYDTSHVIGESIPFITLILPSDLFIYSEVDQP